MLLHPNHGVGFLSHFPSLPSNSFISYDAVQWFKRNVEGVGDDMKATERLEVRFKYSPTKLQFKNSIHSLVNVINNILWTLKDL